MLGKVTPLQPCYFVVSLVGKLKVFSLTHSAQANRDFFTVEAIFKLGFFFPFENLPRHHTPYYFFDAHPTEIDPCDPFHLHQGKHCTGAYR